MFLKTLTINNKKYISRLYNKVEGYILLLLVSFPSSLVLLYFKVGGRPVTKDQTLAPTYKDVSVTFHNHKEGPSWFFKHFHI